MENALRRRTIQPATATEVSTIGIAYTGTAGLLTYRQFPLNRIMPMLERYPIRQLRLIGSSAFFIKTLEPFSDLLRSEKTLIETAAMKALLGSAPGGLARGPLYDGSGALQGPRTVLAPVRHRLRRGLYRGLAGRHLYPRRLDEVPVTTKEAFP